MDNSIVMDVNEAVRRAQESFKEFMGLVEAGKDLMKEDTMMVKKPIPTTRAEGKFADYVRELDCENIGPEVYSGDLQDGMLSDLTAVCRRAFRKKDVIVYVEIVPDDVNYEEGIVFTTDGIFHWTDEGAKVTSIRYKDMEKVDYDDTDILIEHDNTTDRIYLGEDDDNEHYSRHMYSFLMDILEYEDDEA